MKNRILPLLLALTFVLGLLPGAALATGEETGAETVPAEATEAEITATTLPTPDADGVITLEDDLVLSDTWIITDTVTLDLNGHTISSSGDIWKDVEDENADRWSLISVRAGGDLTINDTGTTGTLQTNSNDCYAVDVSFGGKCTINGGKYVGNVHAVYVHVGSLTVNGGEFSVQQQYSADKPYEFTLNCYDPSREAGTAAITVNGGKFYKFDPSNNQAEGPGNSFMAEGCHSFPEGDYYTVKPVAAKINSTYYETLAAAVAAANDNDTITLLRSCEGSGIGLFATPTAGKCPVKTLTIDFGGFTYTMNGTAVGSTGTESQSMHFEKGSDITLKNGTLKVAGGSMGIQNYGNLKLIDFHVDSSMNSGCGYAMSNNCGVVDITGSSSITAAAGKIAFDVCVTSNYPDGVTVNIDTTGTITGKIQYDVWTSQPAENKAYLNIKNGNFVGAWDIETPLIEDAKTHFSITGGTFNFDPSDYVPSTHKATETSGSWTVAEAPTTYTVNVATDITNGTVTAIPTTAAAGETVTLTVTPDSGYELDTLTVTDASSNPVTVNADNTFTMPAGNVTVTATFKTAPAPAPSTPSRPTTTTTTTQNEDGSTTTTKTNRLTGTVTETTKYPDGSSTVVETKKDGTVTTTEKAADGSTTKTVENPDGSSQSEVKLADGTTASVTTDAEGKTQTQVTVSDRAAATAAEENKAVALPIPAVETKKDAETAPAVEVTVPETAESVKVEIPATEVTPGTVAIIVHEDGTEEVVKTSLPTEEGVTLALDGSATVKIVDNSKEFPDVAEDHWAKDSVAFVSARQLFQGDETGNFAPEGTMTRGMVAVVLHNLENNPDLAVEVSFDDVAGDAWYANAIQWAAAQGIISGYGEGLCGAEDDITREQFVTILYRYTALRGYDVTGQADLARFPDGTAVSYFADEAMSWAVGAGLIVGNEDGSLAPQDSATRAQIATILEQYLKLI